MKRNGRTRSRNAKKQKHIENKKTSKTLSITLVTLIIILIIVAIFYAIKNAYNSKKMAAVFKHEIASEMQAESEKAKAAEEEKNKIEETDTTFTMTAIGDIMCNDTQFKDAYNKEADSYDFSYLFNDISFYTKIGDISVGSLETSFAGEENGNKYSTFNTPDALAYNLKNIGLDVISTAGNHCLDMGFSGLSRTIDVLNDADIAHLGTYKTQEEQENILFKYVKGIKIAFINYTYGTNGISLPKDKEFCVNLIDKELIEKQIKSAKEQNADIIVSCMHWGTEYKTSANDKQKELADFLFKNGVDIILGNHPEVLEPMEKRTVTLEEGTTKDGFVIYALGNFICDKNTKNTQSSIILNLTITKHVDGKITIDKANYVPIYMYKDSKKETQRMKVLDIQKEIAKYEEYDETAVDKDLYTLLKTELENIQNIVGPEF